VTDTLQTTVPVPDSAAIDSVLAQGDLSKLTPPQRVNYLNAVCRSLGLNPLTRPFEYIVLNGKLTLYARKDAADQLRKLHKISIEKPDITFQEDWIIVSVLARDADGRTDADTGVVSRKDMRGDFGNAVMKAITKAKRRVTLSICGLGMADETEVETIPNARPVAINHETGEIEEVEAPVTPPPDYAVSTGVPFEPPAVPPLGRHGVGCITEPQRKRFFAIAKQAGWDNGELKAWLLDGFGFAHSADITRDKYDEIIAALQAGTDPAKEVA
jgi:hypothetical protein